MNIDEFIKLVVMLQYWLSPKAKAIHSESNIKTTTRLIKKNIKNVLHKLNGEEYSTALEILEEEFGNYTEFL